MSDKNILEYWLRLTLAPGVGGQMVSALVRDFGSVESVCHANRGQLEAKGLKKASIDAIVNPDQELIDKTLLWQENDSCQILTRDDPRYPVLLAQIPDPPALIYVRGDSQVLSLPQIAIVGSRSATRDGLGNAFEFARELVVKGIVVTSGLATGIDGAAHKGALDVGGPTVAVVGTGVDRVYPARHKAMAEQILEQGAIISEYPLGYRPLPQNFPRRNRIISGLCAGVLVVEAAVRSGSLITARMALEQGREVFAIPGSIHNPLARGCHSLIRDGAKLVEQVADILLEVAPQLVSIGVSSCPVEDSKRPVKDKYDEEYHKLVSLIGYSPVSIDELALRSGLTANAICSMLLILEMDGVVVSNPGGTYQLAAGA